MHVLRNVIEALRPGGLMFDLQVIRPNPVVETAGQVVCEIEGESLFEKADSAAAAVDELVASGVLVEQAVDDHGVREHYASGADLVADFADSERRLPEDAVPEVWLITGPCVVRERCRLRRLALR